MFYNICFIRKHCGWNNEQKYQKPKINTEMLPSQKMCSKKITHKLVKLSLLNFSRLYDDDDAGFPPILLFMFPIFFFWLRFHIFKILFHYLCMRLFYLCVCGKNILSGRLALKSLLIYCRPHIYIQNWLAQNHVNWRIGIRFKINILKNMCINV